MTTEAIELNPGANSVEAKIAVLTDMLGKAGSIYELGLVLKETTAEARSAMRHEDYDTAEKFFGFKSQILLAALIRSTNGESGLQIRNIRRTRSDGVEVSRLQFIFSNREGLTDEDSSLVKTDATYTQLRELAPGIQIDLTRSCIA